MGCSLKKICNKLHRRSREFSFEISRSFSTCEEERFPHGRNRFSVSRVHIVLIVWNYSLARTDKHLRDSRQEKFQDQVTVQQILE